MPWLYLLRVGAALFLLTVGYMFGLRNGYKLGKKESAADLFFNERRDHFKRTLQQWDDMLRNDNRPN